MTSRKIEIAVGLFMALGFAALVMLAMQVSNLSSFGGSDGYKVSAYFENIGGLKVRAPVRAGGVLVGRVSEISYDEETYQAEVTLTLEDQYRAFPLDTAASIYTAGLLGEQYIGLEPGAEEDYLQDGDEITLTQPALVLEQVIGQFLFSQASE
ncbi:MAG: outer membrane lipid asymmetry maintenance protein MlaD [Pseudomonadota bacterium]